MNPKLHHWRWEVVSGRFCYIIVIWVNSPFKRFYEIKSNVRKLLYMIISRVSLGAYFTFMMYASCLFLLSGFCPNVINSFISFYLLWRQKNLRCLEDPNVGKITWSFAHELNSPLKLFCNLNRAWTSCRVFSFSGFRFNLGLSLMLVFILKALLHLRTCEKISLSELQESHDDLRCEQCLSKLKQSLHSFYILGDCEGSRLEEDYDGTDLQGDG